jgi:tellurium resistance protein TerZ
MAISMKKGERISLSKTAPGLKKIFMGLGWDPISVKSGWFGRAEEKEIDLDASVLLFDEQGNVIDTVWFRQLSSRDGSIKHSGDNRTGKGDGDDERIYVDLESLPAIVKTLVFTVNSYTNQSFAEIEKATCRLVDAVTGTELASLVLSERGSHTAAVMSSVYRNSGEWKMAAINDIGNGRTVDQLIGLAKKHL